MKIKLVYRQTSNMSRINSQNLNGLRLVVQLSLPNPLKLGIKSRMKTVGAAPTGDAPNTSEWSTILLPTNVRLILEVCGYLLFKNGMNNFL